MTEESTKVDSIAVVGGGDAGLMTALALEKGLADPEIIVIDDFEESVPEVGKSTLTFVPHFLHSLLDIKRARLLQDVRLAFKTSVFFEDWCGVGPFHSPLGDLLPTVRTNGSEDPDADASVTRPLTPDNEAEFHEFYYRYLTGEFKTIYGELAERPGVTPTTYDPGSSSPLSLGLRYVAYHFDTRSYNRFLREICEERGVELVNDRVTSVETTDNRIDQLQSSSETYEADLYVDASGFKRLLMSELDNTFLPFDLPVDSAVVTTVDIEPAEIQSATVVTSGDCGWFWQIDTSDVRDLGYVYSSSHLSDDAAIEEFVETREEDIDPENVRRYRFESGVLETPWINNCVAAGNALGFVEPLQSTALSTAALLASRLALLLGKYGRVNHDGLRDLYNESTRDTWKEVYQFVSLYYRFNQGETEFWEDARQIETGEIEHCDAYHRSGMSASKQRQRLTRNDADLNNYYLYALIMRELGVESDFYEDLEMEIDVDVVKHVDEYNESLSDQAEEFLTYEEFYAFHPGYS